MKQCICGYKFPVVKVFTPVETPDITVEITCPICGAEYQNLDAKVNIV